MSEFGVRIKNIEAATLYEYNLGLRDHYDYRDAMFTNSLFKDFIVENGMNVWKGDSTRDIITINFGFGTRSFDEEITHIKKIAKNARLEYKIARASKSKRLLQQKINKRKKIENIYLNAVKNKDKYARLSKEIIREIFYENGVDVEYITRNRSGCMIKSETIHYKMLYRSVGKAKKGSCMFIRDSLYEKARNFLYMGIELPEKNAPIVEISAYAPLVSSGIVGKIEIRPENILVLKDVDRYFKTNVISVEIDKDKHCIGREIEDYQVKNALFDGQALIDESIFPEWANGYILLRHHFCKMAAFNTNIQLFYRDYYKEDYEVATVEDMFGNTHYVKDIKLITTDSAMKWLKPEFNVNYDYWCDRVRENGCMFGIVKTAHESKLGDVQRMSYQMVNSLNMDIMPKIVENTVEYINKLKTDDDVFLDYLEKNKNFSNDFEVLIALVEHNRDFLRSTYFRKRKKKIINNYLFNVKNGRVVQNADNLTLVGSPYALLLYGATGIEDSVDLDKTFLPESGVTAQCYTTRFEDGQYLAAFRSPFNSKNNLTYLHNVYSDEMNRYFNLGNLCIAVNTIGTDFEDRNNGSDFDSDSIYTTDQPQIVQHAKECYRNYPTVVNNIPKEKNIYTSSLLDFAKMDNTLSASQTDIGESSNIAQLAQTYSYNFNDPKYDIYACILAVLAQASIDSSKRRFDVNIPQEISRIKKDMNVKKNQYPSFWLAIKKGFNKKNINHQLQCPMNYLYDLKISKSRSDSSSISMEYFLIKHELNINKHTCKAVEKLINDYNLKVFSRIEDDLEDSDYLLLRSDFDFLISALQESRISKNYLGFMSWILDRAFLVSPKVAAKSWKIKSYVSKNQSLLLSVLYSTSKESFLKCFAKKENFDQQPLFET